MPGKGFPGTTIASLRQHKPLIPLGIAIGAGALLAFSYVMRLATKNPEASWDKKNNPHPWQKIKPNQQYKFLAPKIDYSKLKHPSDRPDI